MATPEDIHVAVVPKAYQATPALQVAHENLLALLNETSPPSAPLLQEMVDNASAELVVAVHANAPQTDQDWDGLPVESYVGTLSMFFRTSSTKRTAEIDHVVVARTYQGHGIGQLLVRKAIEIGEARGLSRLDLTSGDNKVAAHALYKKLGFVRRETNNLRYEY